MARGGNVLMEREELIQLRYLLNKWKNEPMCSNYEEVDYTEKAVSEEIIRREN